eukprot:30786-Pleurochrysis_carterae.AAC.1
MLVCTTATAIAAVGAVVIATASASCVQDLSVACSLICAVHSTRALETQELLNGLNALGLRKCRRRQL